MIHSITHNKNNIANNELQVKVMHLNFYCTKSSNYPE